MTAHVDPVGLLAAELGQKVSVDPRDIEDARWDRSGLSAEGTPLCVVHADNIEDVRAVLRLAHQYEFPVVTRGAGTGVAGASFAGAGEVALSLARMNRIREINEEELYAVVEPGVINDHLDQELRRRGLWFAPDPASREISTVGGNIATNAGGLMCTKYGVTREAVLELVVVLPGGDVIRTGRRTAKGVAGLDVTSLIVGSEGTLGVIAEATVRIKRAVPGGIATLSGYFETVAGAAEACQAVIASGVQPLIMELMDSRSLCAVHEYLDREPPPANASYVLIQADGSSAHADGQAMAETLRASGGFDVTLADSAEEAERLVSLRRSLHPAISALGTTLIEDVCVPRNRLADMIHAIGEIERRHGIVIPVVAHAGDGNLHPNFVFDSPTPPPEIWEAADEMFHAALTLGGTLTGEHGVGVLKRRWLGEEIGERQLELQRGLKRAFDPRGIMNPGRVFEPLP